MEQFDLEADSTYAQALATACNAIGRKKVAHLLFREHSVETALRMLDDCLHPERRRKFSIEQIELIHEEARRAECHAPMRYLSRTLAYREPVPITPENEMERLLRQNSDMQKRLDESNRALQVALSRMGVRS